jgi:aminoglycoside phosphotransferase (APT) family kinase protein
VRRWQRPLVGDGEVDHVTEAVNIDSRCQLGYRAAVLVPDVAALDAWLGDRLPAAGEPLSAERMGVGTGIANALYLLRRGEHAWVLRRPPDVKNDPTASDTAREWRILAALEGTPVPHPRPLLFCDDIAVIGAPFLVMDLVDGFTPGFELPEPFASGWSLRHELAMAYVEGCAALSEVDWQARGLDGLGKPEGFLDRQVPRWLAQLDRYRTRDLPELDFVTAWLASNTPTMSAPAIIHGDYSPFNVMIAPEPPTRLAAIVDWDTGTIGDPLLDIGHLLARWTEPGEEPVIDVQAGGVDGYPTRTDMAARYAERTGRDLRALAFYEVLALFKLAVILEGSYAREGAAGVPAGERSMVDIVPRLLRGAAEFARGERT